MQAKAIAIDGNSLLHRAFYALPPMTTRSGVPVGAVYGFLSMLFKLIEREPEYLMVAFDMPGPTFRHETFAEYKAGRKPTPPELVSQLKLVREVVAAMGVTACETPGFEADDILGAFARMAGEKSVDALLVTGDRDALQLAGEHVHVLLTKRGITETEEYTPELIRERYGVTPCGMVDIKGLMGDASDNIPGVPGVGEKTAVKLIAEYGSLDEVLAHAGEIKGKLGERVREFADQARMSRTIATIDTCAPKPDSLACCAFDKSKLSGAREVFAQLEFRSLLAKLPEASRPSAHTGEIETVALDSAEAIAEAVRGAETLALDAGDALLFALEPSRQYRAVLGGTLIEPGLEPGAVYAALKSALEDVSVKKIVFDSKRWMHALDQYGITLAGDVQDVMIMDYLLNATRPSRTLAELAAHDGAQAGAAQLFALSDALLGEIRAQGMEKLLFDVELPLTRVLYDMEKTGFAIDTSVLEALSAEYAERIGALEETIYALAGEKFNILSPKQLGAVLFDSLGLPANKKTKNGYSTDSEVLEKLMDTHPVIAPVLEYRTLTKLKSTFIDGLLALVDKRTGRIHTSFNQTVTATGRISSTEPNLQNIPVRTDEGRLIRKAFVASGGNVLVGGDYSQIELRVLAHAADDETMIAAFNAGEDIHRSTAAQIAGVPLSEVTPAMRSAAKAVNFGIVYGISDFGLARNIGITRREAGEYIRRYLDRYAGVRDYMDTAVKLGKERGYAQTLLGRRRRLDELNSSNYNVRSFGERVAMNMPIQGSAADIIKLAMVRAHQMLKDGGFKTKLILQIHDELIFDAPEDEAGRVMDLVHACMESVMQLRVKLEADVHDGHSWYDTK